MPKLNATPAPLTTQVSVGAGNREGDQYPEFRESINARFQLVVGSGLPLFVTDAEGLFDMFLANLPAEARQHYTCNACRHFVDRFGGLVFISESGEAIPAIWDEGETPEFFGKSVAEMEKAVLKAKVTGVFISEASTLGQPVTGEWEHMFVSLPQGMVHRDGLKTAGQKAAEKREDYKMLSSALQEYPVNVVDQAVTLLKSEALYRSDKVLGVAEWFKALKDKLERKGSQKQANIKWLAVATAPAGFCHVKPSMIGTLLDDLTAGLPIDAVSRRFREKMDPLQYMRPQAAPTQGNIQQAEKIVEKLGIAASLRRRYAMFAEIPNFLWKPTQKVEEQKAGGVFGHLTPKGAPAPAATMSLPSTTMTWEKFQKTVLPTAEAIEAMVPNADSFVAVVTASDPSAPNILRWGNPFSWYYLRGSTHASWGMPAGGFAKVKGIIDSPDQWGDGTRSGHQIFFLLDGCRDVTGHPGGGFFPETLKSDLHEVRSTLEAYANQALIEGAEEASACGAGYSTGSEWNLTLKVTANNSTRLVKIDRWD